MLTALLALVPALSLPLDCQPGRSCWTQKYVDTAPGPERRDYRCGPITTDGHDGVDFRLARLADLARGVAVRAAAPGIVLRVRDGVADRSARAGGDAPPAGNGVVIDHGDGWETQYSHLRRGSVRVRPGETVAAGAPIGLVGLSGETEYPHLHFAVRHRGEPVDPFTGTRAPASCGAGPSRPLWDEATRAALGYARGAVVRFVITTAPMRPPLIDDAPPPARTEPLVAVVELIGPEADHEVTLELIGPAGQMLARRAAGPERPYLVWTAHLGLRAPAGGWPAGRYRVRLQVRAGGAVIHRSEQTALLN